MYTRIWFELQCVGILLGECLTVKDQWELLTGDDGVDGGDFTWRVVNMNLLLKNGQTNRQH